MSGQVRSSVGEHSGWGMGIPATPVSGVDSAIAALGTGDDELEVLSEDLVSDGGPAQAAGVKTREIELPVPGSRIGQYEIIRELGRGG